MVKAAAMWEAHQVNHMKSRFAKHYSHALDKKHGTQREQALEKVNAQKLVIARAEMQSVIAQHNDERLTKSELRTKTALNRVKARGTETLQKHLAVAKEATKRADSVQTKAFAAILSKDAASKEKALSKVNAAQARARRAEASKASALKALIVARNKLSALSAKATHGSVELNKELKARLNAQSNMMKHQLSQVKKETVKRTKSDLKKANALTVQKKVAAIKLKLAKRFKAKLQHAQGDASKVATQAQKATISAARLAKKEEKVAASAVARGQEKATKATKRAAAVKAMAAQQMSTLAKQKQLALRHFAMYNKRLKTLENEKSAKAQAKIDAQQEAVHQSQEAAARVARFAQTQIDNLEVEKSKIAIGKAATAGEVLKNAIYQVKTVDRRAHGDAVLEMEKQAALAKKKRALEKKQKALAKAKEHTAKLTAKAKEFKAKAKAKKKELHKKKIAKEKGAKHAKIVKEGFTKGVKFAREKHAKRAVAAKKIKEKHTKRAMAAKIKQLAAKSKKSKPQTPTLTKSLKMEAKELITAAVGKVSAQRLKQYTKIVEAKLNKFLASRKTKTPAQIKDAAVTAVKEAVAAVKRGPKRKSKVAKAVHKAGKHKAGKAPAIAHHKKAKAASVASVKASKTAVKASKTAVKASKTAVKAAKSATKAAHTVTKVAHAAAKAVKSSKKSTHS